MSEKEYYLLTDSAWVPENIEIEGEYFSNGKIVTGIGTSFTTDLQGGDWLVHPTLNEVSMIRTVETDTRLELYKPFSQDVSAFDPDYQAVLDYATTQGYTLPSSGQQELQNTLVTDLKDAGFWNRIDAFGCFMTDGDSDFALIDWKRLLNMTAVNSPIFATNTGFQGNGVSAYINTNFNPVTDGVNFTLNDAGATVYQSVISTDNRYILGQNSAGTGAIRLRTTVSSESQIHGDVVTSGGSTNNKVIGNLHTDRLNSTTIEQQSPVDSVTKTSPSTGYLSQDHWVLRIISIYTDAGAGFYIARNSFNSAEKSELDIIIGNYVSAL